MTTVQEIVDTCDRYVAESDRRRKQLHADRAADKANAAKRIRPIEEWLAAHCPPDMPRYQFVQHLSAEQAAQFDRLWNAFWRDATA